MLAFHDITELEKGKKQFAELITEYIVYEEVYNLKEKYRHYYIY